MVREFIISMHPRRWLKNVFMFAALVFGMKLAVPVLIGRSVLAFACFCLLSSAAYLINDMIDVERDKHHPGKRSRPLAAGKLQRSWAKGGVFVLALLGLGVAVALDYRFALVGVAFLAVELAYSFLLTNFVILDVLTIAAAFVLRVMAGSIIAEATRFSPWLYVCGSLLALFLALSKRRQELIILGKRASLHRKVLVDYDSPLLGQMTSVVASSAIIAYSLYTFWGAHVPGDKGMMLTIPFVLYGVLRYLLLMQQHDLPGSPEEMLIKDLPLVINNVLWGVAVVGILYVLGPPAPA